MSVFLDTFHEAVCHGYQTLHFAGNDDLGGFSVGDFLHGFDGLELDHLVVGCFLIQDCQRICQGFLNSQNCLGFAVGLENGSLLLGFCLQNGGFLLGAGPEDGGFLLTFGDEDGGLLLAFGLEDGLAAVTLFFNYGGNLKNGQLCVNISFL